MRSVGIDVGTSTTQVIFSALTVEDRGSLFRAPDIAITKKDVLYRGEVHETPLLDDARIDVQALRALVEAEFRRAGMAVGATDTGAVIITGESARKENAAAVLETLSGFAGDFVVATAGPDLESRVAGQGSGAQAYSQAQRCAVANFDIGGGTTNIAVFDQGRLAAVGCYDIGGRQLKFTREGKLTYISPSAARIADAIGLRLKVSDSPALADLKRLAQAMASLLEASLREQNALLESVRTKGSSALTIDRPIDAVCFSGGVADCIYTSGRAPFEYGDFGVLLGEAVRRGGFFGHYRVLPAGETIRATVIGAGSYTTTLSGSTIRYSDAALFPMKNLPVYACTPAQENAAFDGGHTDLQDKLRRFLEQADADCAAVAFEGKPSPGWQELKRFAQSFAQAMCAALPSEKPLVLLARRDMGKALGQAIAPFAQGRPVVSLDGIDARQGDCYLDIGRPLMQGQVVPVVVKTLIFNA